MLHLCAPRISGSDNRGTRREDTLRTLMCAHRAYSAFPRKSDFCKALKHTFSFHLLCQNASTSTAQLLIFFARRSAMECVINGDSREDRPISVTANPRIPSCHRGSNRPNADTNFQRLKHGQRGGTAQGQARTDQVCSKQKFHLM